MIEVLEYTLAWPAQFEELRRAYDEALTMRTAPFRSIEHVGSTAVPDLAAKPIIDIDIVVDAQDVCTAVSAIIDLGFVSRGELGVPGRTAFVTPDKFAPTNTYVMVHGCLALRNHLAVRGVLRADPALRDEYGQVKLRAAEAAANGGAYLELKSEVLERILQKAGISDEDRLAISMTNRNMVRRVAGS